MTGMELVQLHPDHLDFPPAEQALDDPPGLLAIGGDLSPARLLKAYSLGIFPWFNDDSPILWWSPDPRMTLTPCDVHVSKSMRKLLRQGHFQIRLDEQFEQVIEHCAIRPVKRPAFSTPLSLDANPVIGQDDEAFEGTWITEEMQQAYTELHRHGYAHSVEVYDDDNNLVGGLYGISLGRMFFGESMFSLVPNASKVAFISLATLLENWRFTCIDCQMPTDHLASLGARPQSRHHFLKALAKNDQSQTIKGSWAGYRAQCERQR
ncbi:leucyl/phenylalanyl-tRNA--protein transferase [Pseudohongiella nitratireducens]|uniref:Leucyl/phenylalanyl-tRNA--protein transferase n=2 Tax=Pseudohongiella nitratireducens TaxID=1768907 RepID=A0A917LPE3_9GAMM|nr:leucyl/phenylalanyl-tRNA--protein transferase [Pseudohongiella nitratireducens]